jgi:hypothetical protein
LRLRGSKDVPNKLVLFFIKEALPEIWEENESSENVELIETIVNA